MKRLVSILLLAMPLLAMAQTQTSVTLEAAGQLSEKIAEADRFKIAELKISGPMNGADIKLMQEIVNRTKAKTKNGECLVTSVDLSGATIVEGKDGMKTKANELPNGLFQGAKLMKVLLPQNVLNVSKNCFMDCKELVSIAIPESVTTIDNQAFQNCEKLVSVSIPAYVTEIGSEAFEDCSALTTIDIPANVREIGKQVFQGCKQLTTVNIMGNIKEIPSDAFHGCKALKTRKSAATVSRTALHWKRWGLSASPNWVARLSRTALT